MNTNTIIKANYIYKYVIQHGVVPNGYKGGGTFHNKEKRLPQKHIYKEYDINPYNGTNRGKERLIINDDNIAYYTIDHYYSFSVLPKTYFICG